MCKFCVDLCHFSWNCSWGRVARMIHEPCLAFEQLPECFLQSLRHFTFSSATYEGSLSPSLSCQHIFLLLFSSGPSGVCEVVSYCGLFLLFLFVCLFLFCRGFDMGFLVINDVEYLYIAYWPFFSG